MGKDKNFCCVRIKKILTWVCQKGNESPETLTLKRSLLLKTGILIMARIAQPVSSEFDFEVVKEELLTQGGKPSGFFANVRQDSGKVIGVAKEGYQIVQNKDVIDAMESAFEELKMDGFSRSIYSMRGGSALAARYDFLNNQITVPKVKDILGIRLTARNSFDGTAPVCFEVGYVRLVCTNGMRAMVREFSLARRHSKSFEISAIKEQITLALEKAKEGTKAFGEMAKISISQEKGENVINNLVARKVISSRSGEGVLAGWRNPRFAEDKSRNLYNLYNAFTEHLTHNIEKMGRFEMSERESAKVAPLFDKYVKNREVLEADWKEVALEA